MVIHIGGNVDKRPIALMVLMATMVSMVEIISFETLAPLASLASDVSSTFHTKSVTRNQSGHWGTGANERYLHQWIASGDIDTIGINET